MLRDGKNMVLRPSSSSWSIAPETIMSHHYRLTRGVRGKVDTSPPFSMYNSPISVHYIPKRASSADAAKRRQPKDAVYTYVIDREVFTDGVIAEAVDIEIEKWSNQISWDDLEYLRSEIFDELGVRSTHFASEPTKTSKKDTKKKSRSSTSTGSRSTTPTSSGSSLSEMKSNSERVSESDSDSSSTSEESDGSSAHSGSKSGSNNSTASSSSSK
ncbi:hypothetical protein ANCCEY_00967 [Ancylostoma ceylanicum]|uniref:Uncharacterized protein n=1 Tax=Ancylostoma ceylanicum TaxID=53326 RepID=A0A0D6MAZ4_9BILA|nr:hypothetical protein ANCCEY_00967 [Ancylostoma ceylanicum]